MKSNRKQRVGSLRSLSGVADRISAVFEGFLKLQKRGHAIGLEKIRREYIPSRLKTIQTMSRTPEEEARLFRELVKQEMLATSTKEQAHLKSEKKTLQTSFRLQARVNEFRHTRKGKAIRIVTGGPQLWARTWRARKNRKK